MKDIYGFNRESCNVVKVHLRELISEIFFEYLKNSLYPSNNKKIEYFKSLNKILSGERGKFFEYCFGKYTNNELVFDLIFKIDYIGNLLDNMKYFVKEDLKELQKYIINKYKITNYKDVTYDDKDLSFEDEIKKMEEIITIKEKMNKKDNEIFESKKDNNFFEVNFNEKEVNEKKEKNEDSVPFFKALHKA